MRYAAAPILADAAASEDAAAASTDGMDAETAERLRSLGYVATIEPGSAVETRTDPKDGIHVVVAIGRGQVAWEARDFETALEYEVEAQAQCLGTHDFREAMAAWMQKRDARYEGR